MLYIYLYIYIFICIYIWIRTTLHNVQYYQDTKSTFTHTNCFSSRWIICVRNIHRPSIKLKYFVRPFPLKMSLLLLIGLIMHWLSGNDVIKSTCDMFLDAITKDHCKPWSTMLRYNKWMKQGATEYWKWMVSAQGLLLTEKCWTSIDIRLHIERHIYIKWWEVSIQPLLKMLWIRSNINKFIGKITALNASSLSADQSLVTTCFPRRLKLTNFKVIPLLTVIICMLIIDQCRKSSKQTILF